MSAGLPGGHRHRGDAHAANARNVGMHPLVARHERQGKGVQSSAPDQQLCSKAGTRHGRTIDYVLDALRDQNGARLGGPHLSSAE